MVDKDPETEADTASGGPADKPDGAAGSGDPAARRPDGEGATS